VNLKNPVEDQDPYNPRRRIIHEPGIVAQFREGNYTYAEEEYAKKRFKFNGLPTYDGETMTPVDPAYRIGIFDTADQNYDEETKKWVEEEMQKAYSFGSDFELFDTPKLPAPWPGYDKLRAIKRITDLVGETGSDPDDVIAYEKENANRAEVIEALEGLKPEVEDDVTVISA
jgi:hypothetical protein